MKASMLDQKDLRRIQREVQTPFWEITSPLWDDGKGFPYGDFYPDMEKAPSFMIRLTIKGHPCKKFNLGLAEDYLGYLGFDRRFSSKLMRFYKGHLWEGEEWHPTWRRIVKKNRMLEQLAVLFFQEVNGESLRDILIWDPKNAAKWSSRLEQTKVTWDDVRISPQDAAMITRDLFRKVHHLEFPLKEIQAEFQRQESMKDRDLDSKAED
jgi:hypothetical protein